MISKFEEGHRVRIPVNNPSVESILYGKAGVIKLVAPPATFTVDGTPPIPVNNNCSVRWGK